MSGPDKDDLAICQKVTRAGGSNLSLVSKGLSKPLQDFFAPAYASMRLIDDLVDESFLSLSLENREIERDAYLARVDEWERLSLLAEEGQTSQAAYKFKLPDDEAAAIFRALSLTLGISNLGPEPWQAMAAAMRRDVAEKPIEDWDDFAAYGWGATVSPTAVYLYLLTCKHDKENGRYQGITASDLMPLAKPIGLFCYLVHIARDLQKDAKKADQLLTLPQVLIGSKDKLNSSSHVIELTKEILVQAKIRYNEMQIILPQLEAEMSMGNKLVFKSLLGLYIKMYEAMLANPKVSLDAGFENQMRAKSSDVNLSEQAKG